MVMFDKISKYVTDMIYATLHGIAEERREIIEYGVYMTVSEIVKISIILTVSIILRILPYVAAVVVIYGIQRTLLGGIHAKTQLGCMIAHSAIVFGVVAASLFINIDRIYLLVIIAPFFVSDRISVCAGRSAAKACQIRKAEKAAADRRLCAADRIVCIILLSSCRMVEYHSVFMSCTGFVYDSSGIQDVEK